MDILNVSNQLQIIWSSQKTQYVKKESISIVEYEGDRVRLMIHDTTRTRGTDRITLDWDRVTSPVTSSAAELAELLNQWVNGYSIEGSVDLKTEIIDTGITFLRIPIDNFPNSDWSLQLTALNLDNTVDATVQQSNDGGSWTDIPVGTASHTFVSPGGVHSFEKDSFKAKIFGLKIEPNAALTTGTLQYKFDINPK